MCIRDSSCSAASQVPGENQFRVAFDGNKAIGVSALRVARKVSLLFAANKTPQFIALDFGNRDSVNFVFEDAFALFADKSEQAQDRGVMNARNALNGADGAPLDKQLNNSDSLVERRVHVPKWCGVLFGERLGTLPATEATKPVPMLPKFFAFRTAIVTGHLGLPFPRSKPIIGFWSAFAARSAIADLPCRQLVADGRAFYLFTTKSKGSPSFTANNSSLFGKSLYAGIHKSKRILNALKGVAPLLKRVTYLYCGHRLARLGVENRQNKLRPCDFILDLLSEGVLKPYLGGLQLSNFSFQLKLQVSLAGNLFPDFFKGLLERVGHWGCSLNTPQLYTECV